MAKERGLQEPSFWAEKEEEKEKQVSITETAEGQPRPERGNPVAYGPADI
ncbi:hypothetical protein JQ633_32055 [Bradyrhizobium tropiciagri]|nr:hypothetical protein [Bradyrhizobium tropiciagri]MBR0875031.1 hypothetical protein [Bradyrhizobium tropiciagri]